MKKETGSVIILIPVIIAVAWLLFSSYEKTQLFDAWTSSCVEAGGQVGVVGKQLLGKSYECFIDGKIETLPGYEKYSTGVRSPEDV